MSIDFPEGRPYSAGFCGTSVLCYIEIDNRTWGDLPLCFSNCLRGWALQSFFLFSFFLQRAFLTMIVIGPKSPAIDQSEMIPVPYTAYMGCYDTALSKQMTMRSRNAMHNRGILALPQLLRIYRGYLLHDNWISARFQQSPG